MGELTVFYILAFLATACSLLVVTSRNPVTSAIYLVCDLFILAGIYATLKADFVAAIQIIVYTGAVVVLFLFVIMLLNLAPDQSKSLGIKLPDVGFTILTVICFLIMTGLLVNEQYSRVPAEAVVQARGNTHAVGVLLFSKYVWPFELASFLILASIVGAVFVAKKDKTAGAKGSRSENAVSKEKAVYGTP
jgi:NADH-quinone oxidoreductase subunit J